MKDFEQGKRVLSPTIFRKSKGPLIMSATGLSNDTKTSTIVSQTKKGDGPPLTRDVSVQEYDIKACMDLKDVHCKHSWFQV